MEAAAPKKRFLYTRLHNITYDTNPNFLCGEKPQAVKHLITFLNSHYENGYIRAVSLEVTSVYVSSLCLSKKRVASFENCNDRRNFRTYFIQEMSVSAASFLRALYS
jgi:hypothetical protein